MQINRQPTGQDDGEGSWPGVFGGGRIEQGTFVAA